MDAGNCHVDGVLDHSVVSLDAHKVTVEIVVDLHVIEACVVFSIDFAYLVKLLMERSSYERSHIEVECRNRLTSVHFVLYGLH